MSKVLTVCVPTYNRASELIQCLHSINEALAYLTEEQRNQLAVIVSDNASPDDTQAVMEANRVNFPWLHYHRNPENVGLDSNFYQVIQMADSEYVWVLGDDDRMKPNALSVVMNRLSPVAELLPGFDLLICNCSTYTHGFTAQRVVRRFSVFSDREFDDPQEVMQTFGIELGYISIQIFRRSRFLSVSSVEYQSFAEYGHSFMYSIYAGLLPCSRTLLIAEPLIIYQDGGSGGFDWYKFFAVGTALILETLQTKGYSPQSVIAGKHQALRASILPHTLVCKRDGKDIPQGLFRLLLPHYRRNWLFWIGMPSLLLPSAIIRALDAVILRPKRRQRALTL